MINFKTHHKIIVEYNYFINSIIKIFKITIMYFFIHSNKYLYSLIYITIVINYDLEIN